jgi:hypothetical protein
VRIPSKEEAEVGVERETSAPAPCNAAESENRERSRAVAFMKITTLLIKVMGKYVKFQEL